MTRPTTPPPAVPSSLSPDRVHAFVSDLFAQDLHAKRVLSLANGVVGVLHAAALGLGLASARGLDPTHDQAGRSPAGQRRRRPWELMGRWVPFLVRERPEIVLTLDWTDHDAVDHTTCMLSLVTAHGRTTPMVWKTITKSRRAGRQFEVESEVIDRTRPCALGPSRVAPTSGG